MSYTFTCTTDAGESHSPNCFEIQVFNLNQRKSKNPRYEEIKESIRAKGVSEPLTIVQHPEDNSWVLSQGGQTRLLICRELYEETLEARFLHPPVRKAEYSSELNLCINHLIENDLRADNSFFEKAIAVSNIFRLLAEELGSEPTQDLLAERMAAEGLPIRRQSITAMLYAANIFSSKLTNNAFADTLSRKMVDQIRQVRKQVEDSLPPTDFDEELVSFINAFDGAVSVAQIRSHFLPPLPQPVPSNHAQTLIETLKLDFEAKTSEALGSGFLVKLPTDSDVVDKRSAQLLFYLVSLSGAITPRLPVEVAQEMGLDGFDPSKSAEELADMVMNQLGLTAFDIATLNLRVLGDLDNDAFKALVRLQDTVRDRSATEVELVDGEQ